MNEEQRLLYLRGILTMAEIEIVGMQAENDVRWSRNESPAYCEEDFQKVLQKYNLHPNQWLQEVRGF